MAHVTVEEAKRHANITFTDDDLLLLQLIDGAESAIANYLSRKSLSELEDVSTGEIPAGLKVGILTMVTTLYMNREAVAYAQTFKVPYTLEFLLQGYKNLDVSTYKNN